MAILTIEQGSMRCDVNISVKRKNSSTFGTRCEIKNLNSVRFVAKAIEYEIARHIRILEAGEKVSQETRGFNVTRGETYRLRSKEEEVDYRYFPDPDLPLLHIEPQHLCSLKESLPELPDPMRQRFVDSYHLPRAIAAILVQEPGAAAYFEQLVKLGSDPTQASLWYGAALLLFAASVFVPLSRVHIQDMQRVDWQDSRRVQVDHARLCHLSRSTPFDTAADSRWIDLRYERSISNSPARSLTSFFIP